MQAGTNARHSKLDLSSIYLTDEVTKVVQQLKNTSRKTKIIISLWTTIEAIAMHELAKWKKK